MKYGKWIIGLAAVGALTVGAVLRKRHKKEKGALLSANNKLSDNYQLLNHWLEVKNEGKSLAGYFLEMGYSRIAIYGMAELANRLTEDLAGSGVEIVYGIDRDAGCSISRIA